MNYFLKSLYTVVIIFNFTFHCLGEEKNEKPEWLTAFEKGVKTSTIDSSKKDETKGKEATLRLEIYDRSQDLATIYVYEVATRPSRNPTYRMDYDFGVVYSNNDIESYTTKKVLAYFKVSGETLKTYHEMTKKFSYRAYYHPTVGGLVNGSISLATEIDRSKPGLVAQVYFIDNRFNTTKEYKDFKSVVKEMATENKPSQPTNSDSYAIYDEGKLIPIVPLKLGLATQNEKEVFAYVLHDETAQTNKIRLPIYTTKVANVVRVKPEQYSNLIGRIPLTEQHAATLANNPGNNRHTDGGITFLSSVPIPYSISSIQEKVDFISHFVFNPMPKFTRQLGANCAFFFKNLLQ